MKLIQENETYIPIYRANDELYHDNYNRLLKRYQKSFKVESRQTFSRCMIVCQFN